jgi:hypothetical protein
VGCRKAAVGWVGGLCVWCLLRAPSRWVENQEAYGPRGDTHQPASSRCFGQIPGQKRDGLPLFQNREPCLGINRKRLVRHQEGCLEFREHSGVAASLAPSNVSNVRVMTGQGCVPQKKGWLGGKISENHCIWGQEGGDKCRASAGLG